MSSAVQSSKVIGQSQTLPPGATATEAGAGLVLDSVKKMRYSQGDSSDFQPSRSMGETPQRMRQTDVWAGATAGLGGRLSAGATDSAGALMPAMMRAARAGMDMPVAAEPPQSNGTTSMTVRVKLGGGAAVAKRGIKTALTNQMLLFRNNGPAFTHSSDLQTHVQRSMQQINRNMSLSAAEKQDAIKDLMTSRGNVYDAFSLPGANLMLVQAAKQLFDTAAIAAPPAGSDPAKDLERRLRDAEFLFKQTFTAVHTVVNEDPAGTRGGYHFNPSVYNSPSGVPERTLAVIVQGISNCANVWSPRIGPGDRLYLVVSKPLGRFSPEVNATSREMLRIATRPAPAGGGANETVLSIHFSVDPELPDETVEIVSRATHAYPNPTRTPGAAGAAVTETLPQDLPFLIFPYVSRNCKRVTHLDFPYVDNDGLTYYGYPIEIGRSRFQRVHSIPSAGDTDFQLAVTSMKHMYNYSLSSFLEIILHPAAIGV